MYQILSTRPLITVAVTYRVPEVDEPITVSVSVDYAHDRVFFLGESNPQVDYEALEQDILKHLRPTEVPHLDIPAEYMDRINKVRAGHYRQYGQEHI